ncbi:hypothetical protein PG997_002021 [Apiospora hydei]|uniref:Uncharacterized protein n=1 Tax=Apiospora hydei TaxID=1337664 RepID=A0ABR1X885_9PEZI
MKSLRGTAQPGLGWIEYKNLHEGSSDVFSYLLDQCSNILLEVMAAIRFSRLPASSDDLELSPSPHAPDKPSPPPGPKTVQFTLVTRLCNATIDLLLFSGCLAFLVFAYLAKTHDNTWTGDNPDFSNALLQASKYRRFSKGPTVFPILFAAIGGRSIKTFIQWRLQRGERLGTLDLLASSTTVGGAATAQLNVRRVTVLGTILPAIWALSPIGGQASLRLLSTGKHTTMETFMYFKPRELVHQWANENYLATQKPILNSLWVSQLISSSSDPKDMWDNVKIPMVEFLEADKTRSSDGDGWYDAYGPGGIEDASMVGVPVLAVVKEPSDKSNHTDGTMTSAYLMTPDGHRSISAGVCSMSTVYVEAEFQWNKRGSYVSRVRRSRSPSAAPSWTVFDCLECNGTLQFDTFARMFTTSLTRTALNPTLVSSYMANPSYFNEVKEKTEHEPASTLPRRTYSTRLTQLLNSYWGLLTGQNAIIPYNDSYLFMNLLDPAQYAAATGSVTRIDAVLKCHSAWLVTCVFASSILLVLCLATPLLRAWTVNPQLALNFSSLLRDDPYVSGSGSGTSFEASDRARTMGDLKIKFGDVKPDDPVGHIALASMDANFVGRVRKGRKYT